MTATLQSLKQQNMKSEIVKLIAALKKERYKPEEVAKLRQLLPRLRDIIYGRAEVMVVKHVVDCNIDPVVPEDWKLHRHNGIGKLELELKNGKLHRLVDERGRRISLNRRRAPANVLDYLVASPHIIPDDRETIYFRGTEFLHPGKFICIRVLIQSAPGHWMAHHMKV